MSIRQTDTQCEWTQFSEEENVRNKEESKFDSDFGITKAIKNLRNTLNLLSILSDVLKTLMLNLMNV